MPNTFEANYIQPAAFTVVTEPRENISFETGSAVYADLEEFFVASQALQDDESV